MRLLTSKYLPLQADGAVGGEIALSYYVNSFRKYIFLNCSLHFRVAYLLHFI